jgi:hypothetical protein
MSGNWPTVLELTPLSAPQDLSRASLLGLLEKEYFAHFRRREKHPGGFSCDSSALVLGGKEIWAEICIGPIPGKPEETRVTMALDSKLYEMAYDVIRRYLNRKGLRLLTTFCVAVASTVNAEGFRLRFEQTSAVSLSVDEFVIGLTTVGGDPGLIAGIAVTSVHWPQIRNHWPGWAELGGYRIKEFVA